MEVVSAKDTLDYFNDKWNTCEIRYGDMKKQLAADICALISPIRERILDFSSNDEFLEKVPSAHTKVLPKLSVKYVRLSDSAHNYSA